MATSWLVAYRLWLPTNQSGHRPNHR